MRARSGALVLSLLAVVAPDSPQGLFCACGIQVGGTVVTADRGTIVITFAGTPQPGKFDGTRITTRVWGRTVFDSRLSRAHPRTGFPVWVTLDVTRNSDGSYRLNAIWANVR